MKVHVHASLKHLRLLLNVNFKCLMMRTLLKTFVRRPAIGWKLYMETARANGASASMTNGVCVFVLRTAMPSMWKLWIITEEITNEPNK